MATPVVTGAGTTEDGWEFPHKTLAASTVAKRVGRANVSGNRADLWRQIDDDMAKARRELTKRYQVEF